MFGFFAKAETQNQLRQDVLSGVEKICSPEFSSVKESLASLSDSVNSLTERFSDVEEWEQQAQRQERRRQTALETILENQGKILEELKPSPPLEVLEALAENLTLAYLGRPADV